MSKTYFNRLIVGNSGMLGCIDDRGGLVRLFWPHIDFPQHIDRLEVGIICPKLWQGASWFASEFWKVKQYYVPDTNIAVTEYTGDENGLRVRQLDFALPGVDVFRRCYEIGNMGAEQLNIAFAAYSSAESTIAHTAGTIFDTNLSALIHYKHGYYYSVASATDVLQYQLGGNAFENAGRGQLYGSDTIGMMNDGALVWEFIPLKSGDTVRFSIELCFARDIKELKKLTTDSKKADPWSDLKDTEDYWHDYIDDCREINTENNSIDEIYKRSLLVFALMTDKKTGALMAAPEVDEEFKRCGRYAYCWGRDAAFITTALDRCGLSDSAEGFYRWAAQVQDDDGSWQQRFYMDGNLAPSWGLQIDETGSVIWGILKHYEATGDKEFLAGLWPCAKKGVEFLLSYLDKETGLPWLSFDLWEERLGEHAYSSAAVCAGIEAGAVIAKTLGEPETLAETWINAALKLREAIFENFRLPEQHRFARSTRVKLNGWGEEHTDARVWLKTNDRSIVRDYSLRDDTPDISLLGLSVPFAIFPAGDPWMAATAETLEQRLTVQHGGIKRYENDGYIGGNPWVIATLWAALYHIDRKSYAKAREYLQWAVGRATEQGLLPEQSDAVTGRPAWVIPLTWSHAMFVLVLDGLIGAGEL